jgi:hypothetical protein
MSTTNTTNLKLPSPTLASSPASTLASSASSSTEPITIKNGKRIDKNGFIYVSVKGTPEERGYAQGFLIAERIVKFIRTYAFFVWTEHGRDITFFSNMVKDLFGKIVHSSEYNEYYLEMKGIARGVVDKISKFSTPQEKDKYFSVGAIEGTKIVLPEDSYLEYRNLVYNNASHEQKSKYNNDGKKLIDIDVDIIFLLNCVVTVDYAYSKLPEIFSSNTSFEKTATYKEYVGHVKSSHGSSNISNFFKSKSVGAAEGGGGADRCSAFMAVGNTYTADGEIVCAHITFDNYMMGQFDNIILYIDTSTSSTSKKPSYNILMQTFAGGIFSSTDFFVTSANIIGTETTIGGFHAFELHAPACVRSRKAMQYSGTLDDYVTHLRKDNSGDYANTWYIGHTKSKDSKSGEIRPEIMRIELGLKYVNVEKKTNGFFIGFNACYDARIRNLECSNDGFFDIRRHSGARRVTLNEKIKEYTKDTKRISVAEAQLIIADHYDLYLGKDNPCSRSICAHYDLDKREYMSQEGRPKPYQPKGAVDAKIGTSSMCNKMQFMARWGNACGTDFKKDEFCDLRREWEYQRPFLEDRLKQPWVVCSEVNITKQGYDMSSAIKEYALGSSASVSPVSLGMPSVSPVVSPAMPPVGSPVGSPTVPPMGSPAAIMKPLTGGTDDNDKELKDFIKMFKKQNRKSYKSKNSNTRRNKKNDKKNDK